MIDKIKKRILNLTLQSNTYLPFYEVFPDLTPKMREKLIYVEMNKMTKSRVQKFIFEKGNDDVVLAFNTHTSQIEQN